MMIFMMMLVIMVIVMSMMIMVVGLMLTTTVMVTWSNNKTIERALIKNLTYEKESWKKMIIEYLQIFLIVNKKNEII